MTGKTNSFLVGLLLLLLGGAAAQTYPNQWQYTQQTGGALAYVMGGIGQDCPEELISEDLRPLCFQLPTYENMTMQWLDNVMVDSFGWFKFTPWQPELVYGLGETWTRTMVAASGSTVVYVLVAVHWRDAEDDSLVVVAAKQVRFGE